MKYSGYIMTPGSQDNLIQSAPKLLKRIYIN